MIILIYDDELRKLKRVIDRIIDENKNFKIENKSNMLNI